MVQESFQPAKTFQELRRQEEQTGSSNGGMQGQGRTQAHQDKVGDSGSQKERHRKGAKRKEQLTCFNCNKKGYFKKDCPEVGSSGTSKSFSCATSQCCDQ